MNTIIPERLQPYIDTEIAATRAQFAENNDDLLPLAHVIGDKHVVIGLVFSNDQEKQMAIQAVAQTAQTLNAHTILTRMESWAVKSKSEAENKEIDRKRASGEIKSLGELPDAIELVVLMVDTKDESWVGCADIKRVNGKRELGEFTWSNEAAVRWVGLLRKYH